MSQVMEYKCPSCGGYLEFDAVSQKLKCPYCESVFEISDFTDETKDTIENGEPKQDTNGWTDDELKDMYVYGCKSCGGEIIGDETLGATRCPYCGNNVVMKEQFSGDLRPDLILPFSKTKEEAIANLESHVKRSIFAPKSYRSRDSLSEIRGVYVPFWLYDTDAEFDMSQIIYDYMCLALPMQRVHRDGECNPETVKYFDAPMTSSQESAQENPFAALKDMFKA